MLRTKRQVDRQTYKPTERPTDIHNLISHAGRRIFGPAPVLQVMSPAT